MSSNAEKLITAIREVAKEFPDGNSPNCAYYDPHTGDPSCIVGRGMAKVGLIPEYMEMPDLKTNEKYPEWNTQSFDYLNVYIPELQEIDSLDMEWIRRVQSKQDSGTPWGRAVTETDEEFAENDADRSDEG